MVVRSSIWSAAQDCSPTVTTIDTNRKKQSPKVSVYPLRLAIGEWKCSWRHEIFVFDMFTVDIAQYCPHYTMGIGQYCQQKTDIAEYRQHKIDTAQYCPQNIQWILLNTVHRIFNGYCSILSTEYWMGIAQYRLQIIQCFWDCTIKTSFTRLTQHIAHTFNIKSRRSITQCNNIPSRTVQ